jgi:hypothetical protein
MGRTLIILGLALVAAGLLWPVMSRMGLGRLPGDIVLRRSGFSVYIPLATCLLISAALTAVAWLLRR